MLTNSLALALLPLTLTLANPLPAPAPADTITIANAGISAADTVPNSYIIVYKSTANDGQIKKYHGEILAKLGKKPVAEFNINGFKAANVVTDAAGLAKVGKNDLIDYIEKDAYVSVSPTTNNTKIFSGPSAQSLVQQPSATWGLGRISHKLRGYFNYIYDTSACQNTRTYVLDTGILIGHSEFQGRAVWGANFIAGSPNTDEHGHGTHCAGTVAGANVGVCKKGTVVAVKVLSKTGSGTCAGIIAGMQWALNDAYARGMQKRSVFSMSLGGSYSSSVNAAVASVVGYGIPVVVAAGNSNLNAASFSPASAPSAITVGASDFWDYRASFSNWGPGLDVFAPGVTILSSWFTCNTCYYYLDGTSQATPHVAGLAAYLIAKEGLSTPTAIVNRIVSLSTKNQVVNALTSPNRIAYNGNGN
ncbi:peptidase S8/S53 domain-containing protein [Leptodontidium sp. MPI-SDFR-AT-0119]|nr:peptidase S8/S53 domain-containing protein [Leptodontidium sp. MPI-SDFR-AT-0119]